MPVRPGRWAPTATFAAALVVAGLSSLVALTGRADSALPGLVRVAAAGPSVPHLLVIDGPTTTTTLPPPAPPRHFAVTANRSAPLPTTTVPGADAAPAGGAYAMSGLLRRIGGCESNGDPAAPLAWTKWNSGGSGANGAFQDMGGTWQGWEREFGTDGYPFTSEAAYADPAEQVWVNQHALDHGGPGPWASSRYCWA